MSFTTTRASMAPSITIPGLSETDRPDYSPLQQQPLQKDLHCSVGATALAAGATFAEQTCCCPSSHSRTCRQPITIRRRSKRISQRNTNGDNDATESSSLVEPPVASIEAKEAIYRQQPPTPVPILRLDTAHTVPYKEHQHQHQQSTDFELAQFLSPIHHIATSAQRVAAEAASSASNNQNPDLPQHSSQRLQQYYNDRLLASVLQADDIIASVAAQTKPISPFEAYFFALGIDPSTMPGYHDMIDKDEHDICEFFQHDNAWHAWQYILDDAETSLHTAQYLNDFFSTLPSAPVMAPPAKIVTSIPMSNAFHSLSPVESLYATPFAFDDSDVPPPTDTPALVPDDEILSALTSPMWADVSLFPGAVTHAAHSHQQELPQTISPVELSKPLQSFEDIIPISVDAEAEFVRPAPTPVQPAEEQRPKAQRKIPDSPAFDLDFSSDAFIIPAVAAASSALTGGNSKRKRSSATPAPSVSSETSDSISKRASFTGTRHSAVPLLDAEAPTQKRVYRGPPSKTSKREIPASAARRVASLQQIAATGAVDVEDVEKEIAKSIEDKRRQNTVAARRSRMRKAEHLASLEEQVCAQAEIMERLREEMETWRQRALEAGWTE